MPLPNAIEARGLTRRFGDFTAVAGIDIAVARGEVFGMIGANGAGKTTAIRMLCGTLPPTSGTIRVGGFDMIHHARQARGRIGYVAQRFALYGDLTVRENLALQAGLYGLSNAQAKQRIAWALNRLDLERSASSRASRIPLGYQRRLAVAGALLHEPQVLFLDEPTSGLDPLARGDLWELVYELAEREVGVLITTHYMDEAQFCDRLALMHAGAVLTDGSPQELLESAHDLATLEVETPQIAACLALLRGSDEVLEVVPHAGRVRARLRQGVDVDATIRAVRERALGAKVAIDSIAPAPAVLEDVVVSLLQQHGVRA
ncbi:MAG TPA: ABC transporter ATP-binding protein [Casimicrobiaceae bacterium]|nr:ABC transporter ATP-binding protein [Casimicrobiaceae bacterium]